jgi:hypothetical protein
MSKIIKYNDFIQINPDERILTLDKSEKVKIIDNILTRSYEGGKGLVITYDLSHSGRKINNRIYSVRGQKRGIESLTNPYPKPILKNHNQMGEPIGRFISGEWQDLRNEAYDYMSNKDSFYSVNDAFQKDDPMKIYKMLKNNNLLNDKKWPGLGRMRVQANITDEEAIKKFMDGRYFTFSAGSTTDRHVCSICETDWIKDGMCEHRHGKEYDGETCVFITGDFIVMEGSVVNTPADDLSQIIHMELTDKEGSSENTDYLRNIEQITLTDSIYFLGDEDALQSSLQNTKQVDTKEEDNYKEEEKEEDEKEMIDKEYDHSMSLSDKSMMELHEKGVTYVTQSSGKQKMIIRITYSGSMRKDHNDELESLIELYEDEKTFKVPSGAKGNAQKVLDWKKKYSSEVKGMTPVGWARARQLATKSEIGLSTVKRMAAFARHRKNAVVAPEYKSTPWKDRGYVAWLGWGGTSGVDWAIKISAANDFETSYNGCTKEEAQMYRNPISETEDAYRSSPKGKGAKTPAKPSEKIKGSKKNKKGSASKSNSKISVGSVLGSLKEKVKKHNAKYGKEKGKRVSLGMLKAVYRRGTGAFSSTHRPGMSRSGWGVARVNAFLKLVRSGRPSNPKYKQDNDLLPAGHPRKSSNKSKQKDFTMSENIVTEENIEIVDTEEQEEVSAEDQDLLEEAHEPTAEEQQAHDESFDDEETADQEDSDIDWNLLDLALTGIMEDKALTTEQRKDLPDSAFCGPNRSFPVPDCAHVTAARRLIGQAKASGETKAKIMACVNSKSGKMKCGKSEDYLELEQQFDELKKQHSLLSEKLALVVNKLEEKNISSSNDEKMQEEVEKSIEDTVDNSNEINLEDQTVESPSVHSEEEIKTNSKPKSQLGSFEQKIVDMYNDILKVEGKDAANYYLNSKAAYLPRGFDPSNF